MNPEVAISRAELLISQQRYPQAIESLHQALAQMPNDARAHSLLGLCLAQNRDQLTAATREAEQGVHLAPDDSFSHYILAIIWDQRNRNAPAMEAINQAIVLDPASAEYHGLRGHLLAKQNQWQPALDAAQTGLSHDPEDQRCAAIRVLALERLGRVGDALAVAESAIRQAPDSAHAHASRGWALLQQGQYRPAQESFREALRLEPSSEFARQGMMQALNSSNFFFRFFYHIMIRVSRLDARVQWILIIGLWFGMRGLQTLSETMPAIAPWILPISVFYLLLVMMSWIMQPLFNTFLRFHPFGKHLLSKKEVWASNLIAGTIVLGIIIGLILGFLHREPIIALIPMMFGIYLTIPLSVAFNAQAKWAITTAIIVAAGFGVLYLANVGLMLFNIAIAPLLMAFIYGILIYCFVGQALVKAEERV